MILQEIRRWLPLERRSRPTPGVALAGLVRRPLEKRHRNHQQRQQRMQYQSGILDGCSLPSARATMYRP